MKNTYRWSVRNIDDETLDLLREVKETCGLSYGDLINVAVYDWYTNLPEDTSSPNPVRDPLEFEHAA